MLGSLWRCFSQLGVYGQLLERKRSRPAQTPPLLLLLLLLLLLMLMLQTSLLLLLVLFLLLLWLLLLPRLALRCVPDALSPP